MRHLAVTFLIATSLSLFGCEGSTIIPTTPSLPDSLVKDASDKVLIPGGAFLQGSVTGGGFDLDESPQRTVVVSSFRIDVKEVTNKRYAQFLNSAGGSAHWDARMRIGTVNGRYTPNSGLEEYPVFYVNYDDASAFAEWAGGRLPSEAEWEKAARGSNDGRFFPWGDQIISGQANIYNDVGGLWPTGRATGRSPYGCMDQIGNVWEWCADWYAWDYYQTGPNVDPPGPASGASHIIKGGGYRSTEVDGRCSERRGAQPAQRYDDLGFRCVYDAP